MQETALIRDYLILQPLKFKHTLRYKYLILTSDKVYVL